MFIYLVRHGETAWNAQERILGATDLELSEAGWRQAEALAESMRRLPLRAVYSSDLKRALQTAELLARPHGPQVRVRPGLREMNQGMLEGLTFEELRDRHGDFLKAWKEGPASVTVPGGESLVQLQERAWGVIQDLARAHRDEIIAVVSHNLTILTVLCKILGLSLNRLRQLRQGVAAINLIEQGELGWALHSMNVTTHLQGVDGYVDPVLRDPPPRFKEVRWSPGGGSG